MRVTAAVAALAIVLAGCDALPGTAEWRAHQAVRAMLKDPGSARFNGDHQAETKIGAVVCGTVNARTPMGGYAGASPYLFKDVTGVAAILQDPPDLGPYVRATSYSSDTSSHDDFDKVQYACGFVEDWLQYCPAPERAAMEQYRHTCALWAQGWSGLEQWKREQ